MLIQKVKTVLLNLHLSVDGSKHYSFYKLIAFITAANFQAISKTEKKLYKWKVITKSHCIQMDNSSCGIFVMKVRDIALEASLLIIGNATVS